MARGKVEENQVDFGENMFDNRQGQSCLYRVGMGFIYRNLRRYR